MWWRHCHTLGEQCAFLCGATAGALFINFSLPGVRSPQSVCVCVCVCVCVRVYLECFLWLLLSLGRKHTFCRHLPSTPHLTRGPWSTEQTSWTLGWPPLSSPSPPGPHYQLPNHSSHIPTLPRLLLLLTLIPGSLSPGAQMAPELAHSFSVTDSQCQWAACSSHARIPR